MSAEPRAATGADDISVERSRERRKQMRDRIALGLALLALVIGGVVYLQSRTDEGAAPTRASEVPPPAATPTEPQLQRGGKLEPAAHKVAIRFLETAVGRTELGVAWDLATPELRQGVSRKDWLAGNLPVPPFPVRDLQTTGFDVLESSPTKVLVQVLLVPKEGLGYVPTRYDLTLERASKAAPWKVSYAVPYAPPGRFSNPE